MTTLEKELLQALESVKKALPLLSQEVVSIKQRMKALERWQATMDMTQKRM